MKLNKLSHKELVKLYKETSFQLPEIYTKLFSHNQKYLAQQLELTGRQMNSISKMLTGNLKSLLALSQLNLEQKQNKLIELNELLSKEKEKFDNLLISTQYKNNPTKLKQLSQQYSFYQTHLTQRKNKKSSIVTKQKYEKYEFENKIY